MQDEDDEAFGACGVANGHAALPLRGAQTPQELAAAEHRRQESDRISDTLGAKLLQGWTMLAEHCPRCGVNIMMRSQLSQTDAEHVNLELGGEQFGLTQDKTMRRACMGVKASIWWVSR